MSPASASRQGPLSLVLRPTPAPIAVGIVVAAGFIAVETLLVYWLKQMSSVHAYGALFLLGVLVVSAGWGLALSVATSLVSAVVYFYFHTEQGGSVVAEGIQDFVAVLVFLPVALSANLLGRHARLRASEAEQRRREAEVAASLAGALAEQQSALRRVATLVARGVAPAEVYPAAVAELSRGLGIHNAVLLRYTPGGATVVVGSRDERGNPMMLQGEHLSLEGDNVAALIRREGRPARIDCLDDAAGSTAERVRRLGLRSAVGAPIIVDGRVWGAVIVGSALCEPLPAGTEQRIGDFADLVATAIANAETRAELTASRARIVTAADQARRQFERDLHDGAQQRVVSLGLQLRGVQASVPPDQPALNDQISQVISGLTEIAEILRELSRGIHPAILSRGGLGPAIKALGRRSPVPVTLDLDVHARLPQHVEVAAYYVVAEALTNAAKHAHASQVTVSAADTGDELQLTITDDGIGGAAVGGGSGLIGLKDRVEAVGGRLDICSRSGCGTTLVARIPFDERTPQPP
ncbi:sensor histidine kinase [Mycolicibacterium litorale]|uniref:sensor histidine kinase n=1 Tax=Mycolicibacterium litorale TaxID=758802 RepID=UPI001F454CE0